MDWPGLGGQGQSRGVEETAEDYIRYAEGVVKQGTGVIKPHN